MTVKNLFTRYENNKNKYSSLRQFKEKNIVNR